MTESQVPGGEQQQPEDPTVAMPPAQPPPPPPPPTQQMYAPAPPPGGGSSRGTQVLVFFLVLLLGLGGGFALAQVFGQRDEKLPDEDLVLFETASTAFPVAGARFTESTYNPETRECNKQLLKQYLRADPHRFGAWLDLQGISENEFDAFVDRLETRILTQPLAVTNHGCFAEGEGPCPFALQSVLAAGTPVWYDPVSRRVVAKCLCSNPLKSPRCPPNCEETPTFSPSITTEPPQTEPPQTRPPFTQPPVRTPEFCERFPNSQECQRETEPPVQTQPPADFAPVDCMQNPNDPACQEP